MSRSVRCNPDFRKKFLLTAPLKHNPLTRGNKQSTMLHSLNVFDNFLAVS